MYCSPVSSLDFVIIFYETNWFNVYLLVKCNLHSMFLSEFKEYNCNLFARIIDNDLWNVQVWGLIWTINIWFCQKSDRIEDVLTSRESILHGITHINCIWMGWKGWNVGLNDEYQMIEFTFQDTINPKLMMAPAHGTEPTWPPLLNCLTIL